MLKPIPYTEREKQIAKQHDKQNNMQEVCKNCIHCHQTKELIDKEWKKYYICTLWLDNKETKEPLLLTLGDVDRVGVDLCECNQLKEK